MKISVLGCGRWGTCIAWYLHKTGHDVVLWGRDDEVFRSLREKRANDYMELPDTLVLSGDLKEAVERAEILVISISSQALRSFAQDIRALGAKNKIFILCMKGLEVETGCRLSEVMEEYLGGDNRIAVWVGPGHVQYFTQGIPNCMVIDAKDQELVRYLVKNLGSDLIRFYYGNDLIGNEIGAASKNVMGIAAGMLDGLGLTCLKGALMARGTREIARLVKAMGGNELSPYGLCHLGDYEATLFSPHSHNRRFGEMFVRGERFGKLAEGVSTCEAMLVLSQKYHVELPVCQTVSDVIHGRGEARELLNRLFSRQVKTEFYTGEE